MIENMGFAEALRLLGIDRTPDGIDPAELLRKLMEGGYLCTIPENASRTEAEAEMQSRGKTLALWICGTDREIRASFERLARATLEVCSARVLPGDGRKTVWFLVSIPKNALLTAISFIVSIVSGAAVAE